MIQHKNYKNKNFQQILETFPLKQKVNFALSCAKDVQSLATDPTVLDCNLQIERWLNGDKSVDLNNIRTIALNICYNTFAANAAYSAFAASYYAASHYDAFNAAYYASNAKAKNLFLHNYSQQYLAYNQFFNEYVQLAQNWLSQWTIPNFPKELDFPLFDYLQDMNLISSLLPKKDYFFYLNLNGFDLKHPNEAELLKLIDTTHIKNILWRIINNDSAQEL